MARVPFKMDEISRDPLNVLFNPNKQSRSNVWDIDLVFLLDMLLKLLEARGKVDLRIAGLAATASSKIYGLKVDSISRLAEPAKQKTPLVRRDVDVPLIEMPYRHESTYPVTLDELLAVLESLIGSIANKRTRRIELGSAEPPALEDHVISQEAAMGKATGAILRVLESGSGSALLSAITRDMDGMDSIRCFLAALYLARDAKIALEQEGDDIRLALLVLGMRADAGEPLG